MKYLLEQIRIYWVKLTCVALFGLTLAVAVFPEKFNSDKEVISSTEGVIVAKDGAGESKARFEKIRKFVPFDDRHASGFIIRDRERPMHCYMLIEYRVRSQGSIMMPHPCES